MASHSSATVREHTSHSIKSVTNNTLNQTQISDVLRRRAESVIQDTSIDATSRAIIQYALEINDPMLSKLVRRVEDGEYIVDNIAGDESENDSTEQRVQALAERICHGDDASIRSAALLVLLAAVETADDPKSLAKAAVEVQIAMLERELLRHNSRLA